MAKLCGCLRLVKGFDCRAFYEISLTSLLVILPPCSFRRELGGGQFHAGFLVPFEWVLSMDSKGGGSATTWAQRFLTWANSVFASRQLRY